MKLKRAKYWSEYTRVFTNAASDSTWLGSF